MKKLISVLLSLCLIAGVFSAMPIRANADYFSGSYAYTVTDGEATIRFVDTYIYHGKNITVPSTIDGYPVTGLADGAFESCGSLEEIILPDSITTIGSEAFYNCYSLERIVIPEGVTEIGDMAFVYCSSLTSITLPASICFIGEDAFRNCISLADVYISDIAAWCSIHFQNYIANPLCFAENLYLNGKLIENLVIPDNVTSIGNHAFYEYAMLRSITFSDSVASIGDYAFYGCHNLSRITIPEGVASIGKYAFNSCSGLTYSSIPNTITSVGSYAFDSCYQLKYNAFERVNYLGNAKNPYIYLVGPINYGNETYNIHPNTRWFGRNADRQPHRYRHPSGGNRN